jgi:hypothetical protein
MSLTVFATPKPHKGIAAVHQRNAIKSWRHLTDVEIVVFRTDYSALHEPGVAYVDNAPTGLNGLPYVNTLFELAEKFASNDLLCYVNADVILLSNLPGAVRRVAERFDRFLMVGQRWDVRLDEPLDFGKPDWEDRLRNYVQGHGELHSVSGKDWLIWRRPLGLDIPPFLVGRAMWDNWVVDAALEAGIPVVDATRCVTAVHPEHGYTDNWLWDAPAEHNRALCDVPPNKGRISEATWEMTAKGEIVER